MGNTKLKIMNDDLLWIITWYHNQCDGDWEHGNGIKIGTLDNPGWYLKVNLEETEIENCDFQIIDISRSENDWVYCSIKDKTFQGFGGSFNLPEIMKIFRDWAEGCQFPREN